MKKIRLSSDVRDYIKFEAQYLKNRSPVAADRFLNNLRRLQINLAHFPQIGFESEEVPVPGIFRLTMGEYLVDYEIVGDSIEVRAIRHGRQRPPGFAIDEDFDFEDPEL